MGLPKHLQDFINGLTDLQRRILREFFYWATRSTVAYTEDGFVGFETTYRWIAENVKCHFKTVQKLVEKLRGAGLLETKVSVKSPNVYRFIQFLKKKWVRNRLYQLLTPVFFVSKLLLMSTTKTTDREEYPHIKKKEKKYINKYKKICEKRSSAVKPKKPHDEIGNFQRPYQQTRADVLEKKNLKRPEYKPVSQLKMQQPKKEDLTIWEKFFNYYTNAAPAFKKMNPYRKEFDKAVDDMIKDSNVDRTALIKRIYEVYLSKHGKRNEDVHPTRQTNSTQKSTNN